MKQVRSYAEAVKINVDWWIEKAFNTPMNQNMGEEGLTQMLMNQGSLRVQGNITEEQIEVFKNKLTHELTKNPKDNHLSVDYNPSILLSIAINKAQISHLCLPCKTNTYINDQNQIVTKYGYGSESIVI